MNVEGKRYVGGDFPVHLLTMGKLFNKRLVPCAFGIKIGLYFHERLCRNVESFCFIHKIAGHCNGEEKVCVILKKCLTDRCSNGA